MTRKELRIELCNENINLEHLSYYGLIEYIKRLENKIITGKK
jgi:hypothetical protein